ncbi:IS30 family transposase [Acidisoma sp. 7E03]
MGTVYSHLTLDDRRIVFRLREAKLGISAIASRLGFHPSTIYRELRRNWHKDIETPKISGYYPTVAHDLAAGRRHRLGKLQRDDRLTASIVARLRDAWSPEQIAGRLRQENSSLGRVCHETIYQYVYGPAGRADALYRLLPSRRRRRRVRYARKPRQLNIPEENTIKYRPAEIAARLNCGHWECDLVGFRLEFGKHKLTTLVERASRYLVLASNPSRHSAGVMNGIAHGLAPFPPALRQSVTFDRGSEFASYMTLGQQMGMKSYFCAPQAPWQKGTVENTNGRLRRFLPLDTDLARRTAEDLAALAHRMNTTPRKCLDFKTPAEVFEAFVTNAPDAP